jgi:hypothetical protein
MRETVCLSSFPNGPSTYQHDHQAMPDTPDIFLGLSKELSSHERAIYGFV